MKIKNSVVKRVFFVFVCFSFCQALLYFSGSLLLAYVIEDTFITRLLETEVREIKSSFAETGRVPNPRNTFVTLYLNKDEAPELIRSSYKEFVGTGEVFSPTDKRHYHYRTIFLSEDLKPILVAEVQTLLVVRHASPSFLILFSIILILSFVVSIVVSFYLSRYTTKPLMKLAHSVSGRQELGGADLSASKDELSYLSQVISFAFDKIKQNLERERHFNRDLSHELRTPLTILNNTLALNQNRALRDSELALMKESVDSMSATIEVLLSIARQQGSEYTELELRSLIEESVLAIYPLVEKAQFKLGIDVSNQSVYGSATLAKLVFKNLVENAIAHSADSSLSIQSKGSALVFSNKSALEFRDDLMAPEIKQISSEGIGQGLYLVKRILDSMAWDYRVEQDEGVFSFIIFF